MKQFKFILTAIALAASTGMLISCGDDDDERMLNVSNDIGVLKGGNKIDSDLPDGYRIVSVLSRYDSGFTAKYDMDGALVSISDGYETYEVSSNPFTISCEDLESGRTYKEEFKIYLNNSGYITKILATEEEYNSKYDESEHSSGDITFSYNSNGQLSSVSSSYKGEFYEDGQKYKETGSSKFTFTYKNKCLTKVVNEWEEKNDHIDKGTETYIYEYDDIYENPFYQYTYRLACWLDTDIAGEALAYLGLFGRASANLPTGLEVSYKYYCSEDGEWEEKEYTRDCGPYRYNKYNAIESADGYTYSYKSIAASRSAIESVFVPSNEVSLAKSLHNMFFKRSHKKCK